jgi:hypothetical protein
MVQRTTWGLATLPDPPHEDLELAAMSQHGIGQASNSGAAASFSPKRTLRDCEQPPRPR